MYITTATTQSQKKRPTQVLCFFSLKNWANVFLTLPTWVSPEVVPTELGGGRRLLRDAWAAPEVDSVSKMYLEILEQIDKKKPKCVQTRDPKTRGQIPERLASQNLSPKSKLNVRRNYFCSKTRWSCRGLSSPLLCAPAWRPAHLLGCVGIASSGCLPSRLLCSTSPRLAA
jgi:hypothetical protein